MHDDEQARRIFARAVTDLASRGLLDSTDRWSYLTQMASTMPAMVHEEGLSPLDTVLLMLVYCLEQFPDAVPLDEESLHGHSVHTLLSKAYETLLLEVDRREGIEFHDGAPKGPASGS